MSLPVCLDNQEGMSTFQCDIVLPAGVVPVGNTDDNYGVVASSRLTSQHSLRVSKLSSGAYRVVIYSANKTPISGTDGLLFTMKVKTDASVSKGPVKVKNIILSNATNEDIEYIDVQSYISVGSRSNAADIDLDGKLTVHDITTFFDLLPYMLTDTNSSYDINNDGKVDISDVEKLVEKIVQF